MKSGHVSLSQMPLCMPVICRLQSFGHLIHQKKIIRGCLPYRPALYYKVHTSDFAVRLQISTADGFKSRRPSHHYVLAGSHLAGEWYEVNSSHFDLTAAHIEACCSAWCLFAASHVQLNLLRQEDYCQYHRSSS